MLNFNAIKLVIWDLDETLWEGTLSNNESIDLRLEFVDFINNSLDRGIVHSICSKNEYDLTKEKLIEFNIWDLFVFPSINWAPKGERIKQLIEEMKLRAENVLLVDDNISNLHEAQFYCPALQICTPEELSRSIDGISSVGSVDTTRPRLLQYRLLEQKEKSKENFSSNEEFLRSCGIQVTIHNDCISKLDRIHDLIMRSNQLNYTKFRQDKDELAAALEAPNTQAAYITVTDSFGDYGIVGFYMIVDGTVVHYLFSCRTLGMLVEQYVYVKIGCPKINVVGEVITDLNDTDVPPWINNTNLPVSNKTKGSVGENYILFKGPCDISQIFSFIEKSPYIKSEFTYINSNGIRVEGHNHTAQILTALNASAIDKEKMVSGFFWLDEEMLKAPAWYGNSAIFLSTLTDGNLGVYKHKETGWHIALCEKFYDLTNPENREKYLTNSIFTSEINFTEESLLEFAKKYEYVDNSDGSMTIHNLDMLYQTISPKTNLILVLGSEVPYYGKVKPSYKDRHIFHKMLNNKIRNWSAGKSNVHLIEIGNYITSQNDYADTINHFSKRVYYKIAQDILTILNNDKTSYKVKNKGYLYLQVLKAKIKGLLKKLLKRSNI